MLDLRQYTCLGAALRDALDRFSSEVCLIEAERDREEVRLSYSAFKEIALALARALEDADDEMADLRIRNLLLRRSAGAAGLQADRS